MKHVNKVTLLGNLGKKPHLMTTKTGKSLAFLLVATNEVWEDKKSGFKEKTEWHEVKVWGPLAESCKKYLQVGSPVYIEGRIETEKREEEGESQEQIKRIVASEVSFLPHIQSKTFKGEKSPKRVEPEALSAA